MPFASVTGPLPCTSVRKLTVPAPVQERPPAPKLYAWPVTSTVVSAAAVTVSEPSTMSARSFSHDPVTVTASPALTPADDHVPDATVTSAHQAESAMPNAAVATSPFIEPNTFIESIGKTPLGLFCDSIAKRPCLTAL